MVRAIGGSQVNARIKRRGDGPVMKAPIENRLAETRQRRGLSAAQLAERVGVRRQSIYAIETGTYLPNTELALKLARELEVSIHRLFALKTTAKRRPGAVAARVIGGPAPSPGPFVRMCRVGDRWVGVPVSAGPYHLPDADGVLGPVDNSSLETEVTMLDDRSRLEQQLVIAGCDPAAMMLAHLVEQACGVRLVAAAASSRLALDLLRDGSVHLAGSHLEDINTGEFNLPFVEKYLSLGPVSIVTLARWEAGLVIAAGNPKGLFRVEDLARPGVTFVNREPGSGSRALLMKLLRNAGMPSRALRGFDRTVPGHLAAAYRVASGDADACLATRSAARSFGLGFVPIQSERYDLVIGRQSCDLPAVQTLLDVLQQATVQKRFEVLTGYDISQMGRQIT
jgi:putative molybdopterin biosynthesis protein